ncbi:hypothetical protein [Phaeodactylibacter xiamenensis]|uniref:hypothetical protein n=1 Tax=Phaeodactylibacter xiamenensis TaxID=1524460 RepID=UPI0024A9E42C|nr:hypothetical protein [Phaeodactylibacter xiamenensis]
MTEYEFTGESLANSLNLEWSTLYKQLYRMGHKVAKDDLLSPELVEAVIIKNAKPNKPEEVLEGIEKVAGQLNIQVNIMNNSPAPAPKPAAPQHPKPDQTNDKQTVPPVQAKPKALPQPDPQPVADEKPQADPQAGGKPVTALVYFAFIFILLYQVEHLATIGMDVSAFPADSLARKISGWLFAVTVSITALLMTLRRGIKARIIIFGKDVSYLMAFAVLDVIFFVLSSAPLADGNWLHWTKSVLVGVTTAFVIYSFNELITKN